MAAVTLLFSGCGRKAGGEVQREAVEAPWTKGQLMTVAATERNRYQNVYTEQIWSAASGTGDLDFEEQLMNQIQEFFTEMTLVCAMAEEEQLELTAQETDAIGQLSREYFAQLTGGDRDFLQVSQQEIYELYSAYHRANRMVEEMTACGVDICGENGEFHTIAVDGPVFHRPIPYCVRQLLDLGDYSVADITVPEKE